MSKKVVTPAKTKAKAEAPKEKELETINEDAPIATDDDPIEAIAKEQNIPLAGTVAHPVNVSDDGEELETLVSSAEYWPFEEAPVFSGRYNRLFKRESDDLSDPKNPKYAGDIIGYVFEIDGDRTEWLIGKSYQIEKAMEQVLSGERLRIEFKGKTENAKKQPLNKFLVQRYK